MNQCDLPVPRWASFHGGLCHDGGDSAGSNRRFRNPPNQIHGAAVSEPYVTYLGLFSVSTPGKWRMNKFFRLFFKHNPFQKTPANHLQRTGIISRGKRGGFSRGGRAGGPLFPWWRQTGQLVLGAWRRLCWSPQWFQVVEAHLRAKF